MKRSNVDDQRRKKKIVANETEVEEETNPYCRSWLRSRNMTAEQWEAGGNNREKKKATDATMVSVVPEASLQYTDHDTPRGDA